MAGHVSKKAKEPGQFTLAERLKILQGAAGIYFFFIWSGRLQEKIFQFKSPAGKKFTAVWLLVLFDALANVAISGVGRQWQGWTPGLPQDLMACTGLGQVLSKYCLSASLAAGLSFPVATLAKSAKMVPVMLGSLLLGNASFTRRQVGQAAAIVGGTSIVTLAEGGGKKGSSSSGLGLALIAAALCCDGLVGGMQNRIKAYCKAEDKKVYPYDMMFWTNLYMALASLGFATLRSELREGMAYCRANPNFARQILKFCICGAMGQACVFYTIANFDSVLCTAVTTTRKLISVLVSIVESGKSLPAAGWAGIGLASAGIVGEVV